MPAPGGLVWRLSIGPTVGNTPGTSSQQLTSPSDMACHYCKERRASHGTGAPRAGVIRPTATRGLLSSKRTTSTPPAGQIVFFVTFVTVDIFLGFGPQISPLKSSDK